MNVISRVREHERQRKAETKRLEREQRRLARRVSATGRPRASPASCQGLKRALLLRADVEGRVGLAPREAEQRADHRDRLIQLLGRLAENRCRLEGLASRVS